ncbi:GntR family transcriptional regulator [Amycolatopsis pittospori]|uniref:GntR family transcriptional regulator n=1 Tax=Amycolatopsis pittospori TaxID=2749434 RepID=UPI0015F109FE|nr:GntR family transcriptional regulator [Amycolatopsis pittospori]
MVEPAYVTIAEAYARRIRAGELQPGSQLPSYTEIASEHGVSDIVVRKALGLLQSQGLIRSVRRRGVFVAESQDLALPAAELRSRSEPTFGNESNQATNQEALTAYTRALDDLREMQAKHHAEARRSFAEVNQGIAEINTLLRALIDKA